MTCERRARYKHRREKQRINSRINGKMRLLDPLYELEVYFLHVLQQLPCFSGPFWENFWLASTKIGDPAWTFVVYFPLIFPLAKDLALRFLVAGAISEFINGILKWLLNGDRPYWYIKEPRFLASRSFETLSLKQFEFTCETGPGSPSGHVMVTASVFYVILQAFSDKNVDKNNKQKMVMCNRILYISLLMLVSVSRLYIAAHFPHQVFLGIACGVVVGHLCTKLHPSEWKLREPLLLASGLVVFGVGAYAVLHLQGFDPNWSIAKARKHCERPEWIHLSTTPWTALFRDLGSLLGLAIGLGVMMRPAQETPSTPSRVFQSFFSLAAAQCLFRLPLPQSVIYVYYGLTLLLHVLTELCVIAVLPVCVSEGSKQLFLSRKHRAESSCANKTL